jgi:hypothetical protein
VCGARGRYVKPSHAFCVSLSHIIVDERFRGDGRYLDILLLLVLLEEFLDPNMEAPTASGMLSTLLQGLL